MGFLLAEFVVIKHDKHSGCNLFKKLHLKNDGLMNFDFVNAMQQVLHCPEIIENLLKVVDQ
jgi:hypothetical protein